MNHRSRRDTLLKTRCSSVLKDGSATSAPSVRAVSAYHTLAAASSAARTAAKTVSNIAVVSRPVLVL